MSAQRVKVLLESNETEHWHNNCIYIDCHQYCDDHDHWIARKKGRWRCQIHRWQITSGASYKATSKGTLSPSYCQNTTLLQSHEKREPFLFSFRLLSILRQKNQYYRTRLPLVTHDLTSMGTKKSGFISINDFGCSTILPTNKMVVIMHSVWNWPKMSHSTLRARRATFTFWVDKSYLKCAAKYGQFVEFFKTWNLQSSRFSSQVISIGHLKRRHGGWKY